MAAADYVRQQAQTGGSRGGRARAEHELQRRVAEWLMKALPPRTCETWWTAVDAAIPLPGKEGAIIGAMRKARGVRAGVPDLVFLHRGQLIAIELKAPDGSMSMEQQVEAPWFRRCGGQWHEARSLEDVAGILESHGVRLRARLT